MCGAKGGLLTRRWDKIPTLDFACGTVVHIAVFFRGFPRLVCALYLGSDWISQQRFRLISCVLSFIGACLLWGGLVWNSTPAARWPRVALPPAVATHFASGGSAAGRELGAAEWIKKRPASRAKRRDFRRGGRTVAIIGSRIC